MAGPSAPPAPPARTDTHEEEDLPTAVVLAYKLETALAGSFGEDAATISVLTARAWLTLCRRTDRYGTTELLITTALRCQAARYRPEADTIRTARNATPRRYPYAPQHPQSITGTGSVNGVVRLWWVARITCRRPAAAVS
ncbi:hypothetical protein ABT237_37180 [Streptomyces sp. NPDC001581]|uniref:hypothetical protein n=1 Tax=Streptomyces sp. NPDC001581 TaxID=3154386 RepID=UPI003328ABA3